MKQTINFLLMKLHLFKKPYCYFLFIKYSNCHLFIFFIIYKETMINYIIYQFTIKFYYYFITTNYFLIFIFSFFNFSIINPIFNLNSVYYFIIFLVSNYVNL
jgi:hypothetical protein